MFELSNNLIQEYDQKYLEEIMNLNKDLTGDFTCPLEKLRYKETLLHNSCEFWDTHKESIEEFTELVYLMKHYIQGNLYTSYDYSKPLSKKRAGSIETLKKLANNGVLTTKSQRSIINEQKSHLEFRMLIPSTEIGLKLLSNMSSLGMNISAIIYDIEDDITMEEMILDNDCSTTNIIIYKKLDIFDIDFDDFQKYENIPEEHCLINKSDDYCRPEDVSSMINELEEFNNMLLPAGYSFLTATIHNQDWDDKQADKILLNEIENLKKDNCISIDQ